MPKQTKSTKRRDKRKPRTSQAQPPLLAALRNENEELRRQIALLETLCVTAQNRIKTLESELDPNAPEKLSGDELETILQAVLQTPGPIRYKRR